MVINKTMMIKKQKVLKVESSKSKSFLCGMRHVRYYGRTTVCVGGVEQGQCGRRSRFSSYEPNARRDERRTCFSRLFRYSTLLRVLKCVDDVFFGCLMLDDVES